MSIFKRKTSSKTNSNNDHFSIIDLIKQNTSKYFFSKKMTEEIIRWKSVYDQSLHSGEASNPREVKLEKLIDWINPDTTLKFEFENNNYKNTFDEMEDYFFKLLKTELFGFLSLGSLDTYIIVGKDIFISRVIKKDLLENREKLFFELEFINQMKGLEYYERYSNLDGKDVLVVGVKVQKITETRVNKRAKRNIRIKSAYKKTEINI